MTAISLATSTTYIQKAAEPAMHPVDVYLAKATPAGRRSLVGALRFAFGTLGLDYYDVNVWRALNFATLAALQARLVDTGKAPATINHAMCAVRGVLKIAYRLGIVSREAVEHADDVAPVKASSNVLAGREVKADEVEALLAVCKADGSPAGRRDAAIIGLMWSAGFRRAEVASLELASLTVADDLARIVVTGKGRKTREAFVAHGALAALKAWLAVRGTEAGALFGAVSKAGTVSLEHMSAQAVYNALAKRQKAAGLAEVCTPHDFRRSCAGNMIEAGIDLPTVADILGHASVTTTARYDRRSSERKRKASRLINTPY